MQLSPENQHGLQKIATATGRSLSAVTNEALSRWFEKEGDLVLENVERATAKAETRKKAKVLEFSGPHIEPA